MRPILLVLALVSLAGATVEVVKPSDERPRPNPLLDISGDMELVTKRLSDKQTGTPTQDLEKAIIRKLEDLINQADQQNQNQSQNQKQQQEQQQQQQQQKQKEQSKQQEQSQNPAARSTPRKAGGQAGALGEIDPSRSWLPMLPPRMRDELLDALGEEFPEQYKALLKLYYESLSKQR